MTHYRNNIPTISIFLCKRKGKKIIKTTKQKASKNVSKTIIKKASKNYNLDMVVVVVRYWLLHLHPDGQ